MLVSSLLSLLSTVYKYGDAKDFADRNSPEHLGNELLSMLAAAPLLYHDMRKPTSVLVVASDAAKTDRRAGLEAAATVASDHVPGQLYTIRKRRRKHVQ